MKMPFGGRCLEEWMTAGRPTQGGCGRMVRSDRQRADQAYRRHARRVRSCRPRSLRLWSVALPAQRSTAFAGVAAPQTRQGGSHTEGLQVLFGSRLHSSSEAQGVRRAMPRRECVA